jgi:hypothetical protein
MPIFLKNSTRILFVHIPKTGGSAIENLFMKSGYDISLFSKNDFSQGCSPQHFHRELLLKNVDTNCFDAIFTVIRDPVSRLISEYNFRMHVRNKREQPLIPISAWIRRTFANYKANPFVNDNHIRPQNEYILPECRIYRYEQGLENIIAGLMVDTNLEENNCRLGKIGRMQMSGNYIGKNNELTISDLIAIRRFYRDDYDKLGYPINGHVLINP